MARQKKYINPCECEENILILTAYWWPMPTWLWYHPSRTREDYYYYSNARAPKTEKEFFGTHSEFQKLYPIKVNCHERKNDKTEITQH